MFFFSSKHCDMIALFLKVFVQKITRQFLVALSNAKAKSVRELHRGRVAAAWFRWWSTMLACSAVKASAQSSWSSGAGVRRQHPFWGRGGEDDNFAWVFAHLSYWLMFIYFVGEKKSFRNLFYRNISTYKFWTYEFMHYFIWFKFDRILLKCFLFACMTLRVYLWFRRHACLFRFRSCMLLLDFFCFTLVSSGPQGSVVSINSHIALFWDSLEMSRYPSSHMGARLSSGGLCLKNFMTHSTAVDDKLSSVCLFTEYWDSHSDRDAWHHRSFTTSVVLWTLSKLGQKRGSHPSVQFNVFMPAHSAIHDHHHGGEWE